MRIILDPLQQREPKNNGYQNNRENDAERNKADRQALPRPSELFCSTLSTDIDLNEPLRSEVYVVEPLKGQRKLQ